MANLPQDLTDDILFRLPVKSLLRFRCLSKQFYAFLTNNYFIYSHLQRSSHRKLIRTYGGYSTIRAVGINDGFNEEFQVDFDVLDLRYSAYCNGLFLFHPFYSKFAVWNPSTQQYRELPPFPIPLIYCPDPTDYYHDEYDYDSYHNDYDYDYYEGPNCKTLGFGYDPTVDEYKAVLIMSSVESNQYLEVWIFRFRSSCWARVDDFPCNEHNIVIQNTDGKCFVDGCVYFLSYSIQMDSHMILAFDAAEETLSIVPEPIFETPESFEYLLQAFEGCLSVTSCTRHYYFDIYLRKKEGIEFNWIKLFCICEPRLSLFVHQFRTLGFSEDGDKILLLYSKKMYWYDLKGRSLQKIQEVERTDSSYYLDYSLCDKWSLISESLVSVDSILFRVIGETFSRKNKAQIRKKEETRFLKNK